MQMDRVRHHRVVDQDDSHALAVLQTQGFGVSELHSIERPCKALHVTGQVQLDRAAGRAPVGVGERAAQIAVGQYASAVVA